MFYLNMINYYMIFYIHRHASLNRISKCSSLLRWIYFVYPKTLYYYTKQSLGVQRHEIEIEYIKSLPDAADEKMRMLDNGYVKNVKHYCDYNHKNILHTETIKIRELCPVINFKIKRYGRELTYTRTELIKYVSSQYKNISRNNLRARKNIFPSRVDIISKAFNYRTFLNSSTVKGNSCFKCGRHYYYECVCVLVIKKIHIDDDHIHLTEKYKPLYLNANIQNKIMFELSFIKKNGRYEVMPL